MAGSHRRAGAPGDGHVLAAVCAGLRGLDATVTFTDTEAISREIILAAVGTQAAARGLLDRDGRLTKTGGALRHDVEDLTDRLAAGPVERLGETGVRHAIDLAAPISRHLIDSGLIPVLNTIGAPRP